MSIELDRPGGGVAAFMLSLSTLLALKKNGTLADDELADIVEQSLGKPQDYRCGDERAKPGRTASRSSISSSNSGASRPRSEADSSII